MANDTRYGLKAKAVTNKKANIASEWRKFQRSLGARNVNLTKGQITERELMILLRTAPKTQANLNKFKKLLTKGQISDSEARKLGGKKGRPY